MNRKFATTCGLCYDILIENSRQGEVAMALQLILGGSGSGKSHYMYQHMINHAIEYPADNLIIIVPEQYTMLTQKNIVDMHPQKGVMNIDIVSFGRLAYRVFDEVGGYDRVVLEDTGKNMVLRKVAEGKKNELKVFKGNITKRGFISEIKSMVSELLQYRIDDKQLEVCVAMTKDKPLLNGKLNDISIIYREFKQYIQGHYITAEEILDILSDRIYLSEKIKDSMIYIDEFTGFTPTQYRLLGELLLHSKKVVIALTVDPLDTPYKLGKKHRLFYLTKETIDKLNKLCYQLKVDRDEDSLLEAPKNIRFQGCLALSFLEKNIFRFKNNMYRKEQEEITIHLAKNPSEEIAFIAREIRRLVRDESYRYKDIAIATGDLEKYQPVITHAFKDMEIPCFIDHKRSVMSNCFVDFIRSLLETIYQNLSYESVFKYLKSGLLDVERNDIDIIENYVIATGIRGASAWNERWTRQYKGLDEEELLAVNQIREIIIQEMWPVYEVFKDRSKTVSDCTKVLIDFITGKNIEEKLNNYSESFEAMDNLSLSREYKQVYSAVMELLDKLSSILGEEHMSAGEYLEVLDAGFDEAQLGLIPPSIDQVVVGDIRRTRLNRIKILFFAGVNEGVIPAPYKGGGLLTDDDKELLLEHDIELAPTKRQESFTEQFYLYAMLTKPSEHLYITLSKVDSSGNSMRESSLIDQITALFSTLKVVDLEALNDEQALISNEKDSLNYFISGLRSYADEAPSDVWRELFGWFKGSEEYKDTIEKLVDAALMIHSDGALGRAAVKAVYGECLNNSVTTLELYASCAYAHFLTYGLKLRERQEYRLENPDLGIIFHNAIEMFSKQLEDTGYDWFTIPDARRDQLTDACVRKAAETFNHTILLDNARNQYLVMRLIRITKRTIWALQKQMKKGKFIPAAYEIAFDGESSIDTANIKLSEEAVLKLKGTIDRLDRYEDGENVYLKVVDYKSGSKKFDLVALYYGLSLQLVVYMNAAAMMEKNRNPDKQVIPAGILYYNIDDPMISREELLDDDANSLDQKILTELRMNGLVNDDMEIIRLMDGEFSSSSDVIPVALNRDGSLNKRSGAISSGQFKALSEFTNQKIISIGKDIMAGKIDVNPYLKGKQSACDYCKYSAVCGFDKAIDGYEYRRLMKLAAAEVWEYIEKETHGHGNEMDQRADKSD